MTKQLLNRASTCLRYMISIAAIALASIAVAQDELPEKRVTFYNTYAYLTGDTWTIPMKLWVHEEPDFARRLAARTARSQLQTNDFDGATFTHVEDLVTFEVLIRAFQLDNDTALEKIAAVVHYLDVGGLPVSEADGLVTMLSGIKQQYANDDDVFASARPHFDHLYSAFA